MSRVVHVRVFWLTKVFPNGRHLVSLGLKQSARTESYEVFHGRTPMIPTLLRWTRFRLAQKDLAWAFGWFVTTNITFGTVIGVVLIIFCVGASTPLSSATSPDPLKLTTWFCSSLEKPFDFPKLTKTFPFEQLGDAVTTRSPIPPTGKDTVSTSTSIEQTAKGQTYTVMYKYQYANDEVNKPYGFMIQVRHLNQDFNQDPDIFAKSWMASLGKEEYQTSQPIVGVGEKSQYMGYTANFSYWPNTGTVLMNWMYPDDLSKFSAVCKGKK